MLGILLSLFIGFESPEWNVEQCHTSIESQWLPPNPACFEQFSCKNKQGMHTRRVHGGGGKGETGLVNQWALAESRFHFPIPEHGKTVATHLPQHLSDSHGTGLLEMFTSHNMYSGAGSDGWAGGYIMADFLLHGPPLPRGSIEHHHIIHNIQLTGGEDKDCPDDYSTGTTSSEVGYPNFYGPISGSFGHESLVGKPGCDERGFHCLGFVIEKRINGKVDLIPESYISYPTGGMMFPSETWFRIYVTWNRIFKSYYYSIQRHNGERWIHVGARRISDNHLQELGPGYIHVGAGFFDVNRGRDVVHLDLDNLSLQ